MDLVTARHKSVTMAWAFCDLDVVKNPRRRE